MGFEIIATEEELSALVDKMMKRQEVSCFDKKTVRDALVEHAKMNPTRCANCLFSRPSLGVFSWRRRGCGLSLPYTKSHGEGCPMRKPIVRESDCPVGVAKPTFISSGNAIIQTGE